jgi:hypothetical protein
MPVYRPILKAVPKWEKLVDALAQELRTPTQGLDAPVVFEDQVPQTRSINVIVVWQRFQEVPQERRSTLILDAYESFNKKRLQQIRFASGVTPDEAIRGGYLPYKIVPATRRSDGISPKEIRQAIEKAGAFHTSAGLELRFPYRWLAERVLATLQHQFGEHAFALAKEMDSVDQLADATVE